MISTNLADAQVSPIASRTFRAVQAKSTIRARAVDRAQAVDIGEIRLKNLLALMKLRVLTQAEFAREIDTNPAYVSQMINRHGGRRMGSHFARKVEQRFGLPRGWMDNDHNSRSASDDTGMHRTLSETAHAVGAQFDKMPESAKVHFKALVEQFAASNQRKKKRR